MIPCVYLWALSFLLKATSKIDAGVSYRDASTKTKRDFCQVPTRSQYMECETLLRLRNS